MLHTTFALLKLAGACGQKQGSGKGYDRLATHLDGVSNYGKNTPIPLTTILDSNGLGDALWCLHAVLPEEETRRDRDARLLACEYAERALQRERDAGREPHPASWNAPRVSRLYALGEATQKELQAVWSAARSAAESAARSAAESAAWSAVWSAARSAAWGAAWSAAWSAELEWQSARFRQMLGKGA